MRLAALATKELTLADADVTRISLVDYPLPLYDADLADKVGTAGQRGQAQAAAVGASRRVHRQPGIQRLDHAAAEEHHRLDLARARARRAAARRVPEPRLRARRRLARPLRRACNSLLALRQVLAIGCRALVIAGAGRRCRTPSRRSTSATSSRTRAPPASSRLVVRKLSTTREAVRLVRAPVQLDPRERLIVALDVPSVADAEAMVARLGDSVVVLQDRLSARLRGRARLGARARRRRQAGLPRPQAARHRQHGRRRASKSVAQLGRDVPHRARLSADHARRGRRARRLEAAHSRGHRAHLLRRCRSRRRRLRLHRAGAGRRSAPRRRATSASTGSSARPRKPRCCARSSAAA